MNFQLKENHNKVLREIYNTNTRSSELSLFHKNKLVIEGNVLIVLHGISIYAAFCGTQSQCVHPHYGQKGQLEPIP
jgi:hypothetical protein